MIVLSGVGHKVYVYFHLLERKPNPTYSEPAIELKLMAMKKLDLLPITQDTQDKNMGCDGIRSKIFVALKRLKLSKWRKLSTNNQMVDVQFDNI